MLRKRKKQKNEEADFSYIQMLNGQNLPVLTLDPAWHALFVNNNKPPAVKQLERKLTELLKQQGKLTNQNRDMKVQKKRLMNNILTHMSEDDVASDERKQKQRDMIEQMNEKVVQNEDALQILPDEIKRVNEGLLLETMKCVYEQVHINKQKIAELDEGIDRIRTELSKKLLEKQGREEYNHDVFGNLKEIVGMRAIEMYEESHYK